MYILFYINKIPPAHSFFVKMKIIVEVKKVGKLPSLGMPIEPKIMDGFDTWGYGDSSGNFQGSFRHLL